MKLLNQMQSLGRVGMMALLALFAICVNAQTKPEHYEPIYPHPYQGKTTLELREYFFADKPVQSATCINVFGFGVE